MVLRRGRYGSFYACANYPECKFNKKIERELEGVTCPKCGGRILIKYGRNKTVFYSCEHYPKCDFSTWDVPLPEKCPTCGEMLFRKKGRGGGIVCHNAGCGYRRDFGSEVEGESEKTGSSRRGAAGGAVKRTKAVVGNDPDAVPEPPEGFEADLPPNPGDDDVPF